MPAAYLPVYDQNGAVIGMMQTFRNPVGPGGEQVDSEAITFVDSTGAPYSALNPLPVRLDQSEYEYTPGSFGGIATALGDTVVFDGGAVAPGKGFIIHSSYAVPVVRGSEDPPVVAVKILNAANTVLSIPFIWAGSQRRKKITCAANSKIAISLDIAGRVPYTFDIEVLP